MVLSFLQLTVTGEVLAVFLRIRQPMQVAADHGLWLALLGDRDRLHAVVTGGHPDEPSHKVDEVGALEQELRHYGVVVPSV